MRKIISICLLLTLLLSCAVCVYADGQTDVIFTSNSSFAVGGTATVDLTKTSQTVLDDDSITSDMYNAALEMNMSVSWICSNGADKKGTSVTWMSEDAGKEYTCRVGFYADKALTEFIGFVDSQPFTVSGGSGSATPKIPNITTDSLQDGRVGKEYYKKLECTDPDVRWELFRSSLPDGMYLTQHGEIEGTPTKAGNYYVVVMATPEAGEDYAATAEFELTILAEDAQLYTMEIWEGPKKTEYISGEKLDLTGLRVRIYGPDGYLDSVDGKYLTYTNQPLVTLGEQKISLRYEDAFDVIIVTVKAAPGGNTGDPTEPGTEATTENTGDATEAVTEPGETTDSTKPSKSPAQKGEKDQAENQDNDTDGGDIWIFVAIGLGVLVVGMVVAIVVILKKKKA
jgi:hypothetical protein